jgi:hypothetical protein
MNFADCTGAANAAMKFITEKVAHFSVKLI